MATTTNFGWETPDDTDYVKDGAAAMRTLGNSIDTSFVDLKGGTTGQILSKASGTDLDYTWIDNQVGDITAVTAGTGLSGGGTSGAVTLSIDTATTADLTSAQTLTNKTLTSPVITTPTQRLSFNAQTGTTYTLVAADASYKLVTCSNGSAITVTVPPSVFTTGDVINVQQINTGQVTFSQGSGVTITSTGATSSAPKCRERYSAVSIICTGSDTFTILGDIEQ
ncbi:MAG: hypothetical protein EBV86_01755 [Marivivens sp.]|nr:hypothetical protein [Marivivens sp.]